MSSQPEGEELVVDLISVFLLSDEILVEQGFECRHDAAWRPQPVFLDEGSSCDACGLALHGNG